MKDFFTDVDNVRLEVRREIDRPGRQGRELTRMIRVLNEILALNKVCVLRHMRHFVMAERLDSRVVAQEFLEHTVRESEHSDLIVARIKQFGGKATLERDSNVNREYLDCETIEEFEHIIREDLKAEQAAIDTYLEALNWFSEIDPTTGALMEQILSLEEKHADVMRDFEAVVVD